MKVKYETVTGTVEIDVDEEWGNIVMDLNRKEYNNYQAETRRHNSLEEIQGTKKEPADSSTMDELIEEKIKRHELYNAIAQLEPHQQKLVTDVFFKGRKPTEIAREENVSRTAISLRMKIIFVKLRRTLKKRLNICLFRDL